MLSAYLIRQAGLRLPLFPGVPTGALYAIQINRSVYNQYKCMVDCIVRAECSVYIALLVGGAWQSARHAVHTTAGGPAMTDIDLADHLN